MNVAEIITEMRTRAGLSMNQLADRVGVVPQSVVNWEAGATCPNAEMLLAVCDATGFQIVIRNKYRNGDYSITPPGRKQKARRTQ